jgi:hypothetical protein
MVQKIQPVSADFAEVMLGNVTTLDNHLMHVTQIGKQMRRWFAHMTFICYHACMLVNERYSHLFTNQKVRGLIRIKNLQNNRILLVGSEDIAADIQRIRFSLDLGTYENDVLQQEYETIGLELFSIDAYLQASEDEDLQTLLAEHTKHLLAQSLLMY